LTFLVLIGFYIKAKNRINHLKPKQLSRDIIFISSLGLFILSVKTSRWRQKWFPFFLLLKFYQEFCQIIFSQNSGILKQLKSPVSINPSPRKRWI